MLVPKKFGGPSCSARVRQAEFQKTSVEKKVQKASSRKVQEAKLLRQSSTTKFEKSSVEKKFKMLVPEKFGGPNCSARAAQQSSKKVRWKKRFKMLVPEKFGGPTSLGNRVRKKFDCKEVVQTVFEKIFKQRRRLQKKVQPQRSRDPGGTSKVSSGFFSKSIIASDLLANFF